MDKALHGQEELKDLLGANEVAVSCVKGGFPSVRSLFCTVIIEVTLVIFLAFSLLVSTQPHDVGSSSIPPPEWGREGVSGTKWYKDSLGDVQRSAYDAVEAAFRNLDDVIALPPAVLGPDGLSGVFMSVLYDNPDIFWVEPSYTYVGTDSCPLLMFPSYRMDEAAASELRSSYLGRAKRIVSGIGALDEVEFEDYGQAYEIYYAVSRGLEYGDNDWDQEVCAFFGDGEGDGRAVCAGYAKTVKLLCDAAGLESCIVCGDLFGNGNATHAWNLIRTGRGVAFADATWGSRLPGEGSDGEDNVWFSVDARLYENSHVPTPQCSSFPLVEEWREQAAEMDAAVEELLAEHPELADARPMTWNLWMFHLEDLISLSDGTPRPQTLDEWRELFAGMDDD